MQTVDFDLIVIKHLSKNQHAEAQSFYLKRDYTTKIELEDEVVAAQIHEQIIGVARLAMENNILVLRGMQISSDYQRRGVGTRILDVLDKLIGRRTCWCIPHEWLEGFYKQIGFEKISEDLAPLFLKERIKAYRVKYPNLIMMCKNG